MGWPKGTASRVLTALEENDLLERDPATKVYRIGSQVLRWATAVSGPGARHNAVRRRLAAFSQETGRCAYLCELIGLNIICTDVAYPLHSHRYYAQVGALMPVHASSGAKAIAMRLESSQVHSLLAACNFEPLTEKTITRPEDWWTNVKQARVAGYAACYEEMEPGVTALSVPTVVDGRPMSVSVVGAADDMKNHESELVDALKKLAAGMEMLSLVSEPD
jgi:DNA-binding IclR family transcriptional regulator